MPWLGVPGTIDHALPFHVSAKVAGEGPDEAAAEPTALHAVALKQSTPLSPWSSVERGVPSGRSAPSAHCEPFHASIRFCVWVPFT